MHQTLNRYRTRQARAHRRSRFITPPDFVILITQKKASKREVYNVFKNAAEADADICSVTKNWYWQTYGRDYKMRYRVNVRLK